MTDSCPTSGGRTAPDPAAASPADPAAGPVPPGRATNVGVLAHVDAGKTSLTERILYATGVTDRLGAVDDGTTATDTGALERERGITIRSAVASFTRTGPDGGRRFNLVDTPGHPDFVAEVERALGVLDGVVLVLSAVEGVQPQTRVLMRTLRGLRLPTVLFVNKVDRGGADPDRVLGEVRRRLTPAVVPLTTVTGAGTAAATTRPAPVPAAAVEVLAEHDDRLLGAYVAGTAPDPDLVHEVLRRTTAAGLVHPLYAGSALHGQGVDALLDGLATWFGPAPAPASPAGRPLGTVFALDQPPQGTATAYVRLFAGELHERQRVRLHRPRPDGGVDTLAGRITRLTVAGADARGGRAGAGDIAVVGGLPDVRVGDRLGPPRPGAPGALLPPPSLESVVRAADPRDTTRLHQALRRIAATDPLVAVTARGDGSTSVLLHGEVQREVLGATLEREYGVAATFGAATPVLLERPVGIGTAVHDLAAADAVFPVTVGFRVEPGRGRTYRLGVERGSLLSAQHHAVEEAVRRTLEQGVHGWPVHGCTVTLVASGYVPPVPVGRFRAVTPPVLMAALLDAGVRVHEPCHDFELEVPGDALSQAVTRLTAFDARLTGTRERDDGWVVTGDLPARHVHRFGALVPGLTHGEGTWWTRPGGDRPVPGRPPERDRTDGDPRDRTRYLRHLARTGGAG